MEFLEIKSHEELQINLKNRPNLFLLLYKSQTENSVCTIENLKNIDTSDTILLKADVSKVKDIHSKYNISSAPSLLEFENKILKNVVKGCQTSTFYKTIFDKNAVSNKDGKNSNLQTKKVKVYSTTTCPWCTRVKEYLRSQNIRFTDVDVSRDQAAADRMVAKSGQRGVPQTEINGRMVVGFDKNKIDLLLDIK